MICGNYLYLSATYPRRSQEPCRAKLGGKPWALNKRIDEAIRNFHRWPSKCL